ncbi:hypothetical protein MLD38_019771 [Melastoma candidum]|uniref:Uncharacterized protein n=1 Tax=Melastoma candidum TaxID=119954 RepID=A0ACB9QY92_9MYRT|nr:hypothetical protein MLD38_019771 [Melastoma candidum]
MEVQEEGVPGNLRKRLAVAVRSIHWSYAIFWSLSPTQQGVLEWRDGYYNGDIKTRKSVQAGELKPDKIGLKRSEQLRELYKSLLEGEPDPLTKRPSDALSPEDLTDEEWYYFVCMSFVFNAGEGLPGRALANNQTIWLSNAQHADSKVFSRSLLAKSASIQTVLSFPYLGGVIELGVTDLVPEDPGLLQHIKLSLLDFSKAPCFEESSQNKEDDYEDPICMKADMNMVDTLVLNNLHLPSEKVGSDHEGRSCLDEKDSDMDSPDDCSNGCDHNHQTEDSFMADHPNGEGASQVQSWHLADDDFSNGFQASIHSSDCISEAIANHNKASLSPKHDNANHLRLKQFEECNNSKLICLDHGGDDFSHYKRTISSILKNSSETPDSLCMCCCSRKSCFVSWRVLEVHRPLAQQELLKKALFKIPMFHTASLMALQQEKQLSRNMIDSNCSKGNDSPSKKVEQDKFLVLGSMIPSSIEKMDKASILDDTILYLKELEARVEELESSMEATELEVRRNRRMFPDMVYKTSNNSGKKRWTNKRKASDIDETNPGLGKITVSKGLGSEVKINIKDGEVLIEIKCPYREYMLVDILEAINNLQLDAWFVQSSNLDGILSLTLSSKFRGVAVSSVGMIKQALWKVTGKS